MPIFCTYCTAAKSSAEGNIPAIERYLGTRIRKVHEAASALGLHFYILSGEYGLIPSNHPIPWYDHLLLAEEVEPLAERMAAQIRQENIDGIVYFTNSPDGDDNLIPYYDAINSACALASCPCFVVEIDLEEAATDYCEQIGYYGKV